MDINSAKKYLPFVLIAGVVIWLLLKLSKSGGNSQVTNRVIPTTQPNDTNALAQIQASFELGKLQLDNAKDIASKQVDAEKTRLEFANKALDLQGQYGLKALDIQSAAQTAQANAQSNLAKIALDSSLYDTQIRANAAQELARQQQNSSLLNQLLSTSGGLLQALLKGQQQAKAGSSGGLGSSSGGVTPSNTNNAANAARQRQNALAAIGNWITRNSGYNSLLSQPSYDSLGYASGYDLQQFYNNEVSAYDNWLNFGGGGINDPVGSVTSSFDPSSGYSSIDDYLNNFGDFYGIGN